MPKPTILIITAMHNRPKVSELFALSMERIKHDLKQLYDIIVHAAVSDEPSREVCVKYGIGYSVTTNHQLGRKWNTGLSEALRLYQFDYACIMGDDDIMNSELLRIYNKYLFKHHYFGVKQIYFYSPEIDEAVRFKYDYKCDKLIGCGRMISRQALESTGWQVNVMPRDSFSFMSCNFYEGRMVTIPVSQAEYLQAVKHVEIKGESRFILWENSLQKGLDRHSEFSLLFNGFPPIAVETDEPMITDVKTTQNIWTYQKYRPGGKKVETSEVVKFWGDKEKEFLKQIA